MPVEIDKERIIEFIECYRQQPVLWDTYHPDYNNRMKREKCHSELLKVFKKIKPDATIKDSARKINTLRANYQREKRRQKQSEGCSPTLFYYNALSFLDPVLNRPKTSIAMDLSILFPNQTQIDDDYASETEFQFSSKSNFVDVQMPSPTNVKQFPVTEDLDTSENAQHEFRCSLPDKRRFPSTKYDNEDDATIFGRAWATQFRNLSEDQKIFAKKAIEDILFEAKLGTLHRQSIRINDSLCQHCQTAFINTDCVNEMNEKIDISHFN